MSNTEYLIRLRDLNDELNSINYGMNSNEQIEDEAVEQLGQLLSDVSDLIDRADGFGTGVSMERGDLVDRINQFQCDHVRVADFLSQLSELLEMIEV